MTTKVTKYKIGEIVKVYEDPITKQALEGIAKIIELCSERGQDWYVVHFLIDSPGQYAYRKIL